MTTFPIFSGILQISSTLLLLPSLSASWIFGIIASCGYILDNAKKHVDATRPVIRKYLLLLWDPVLVSSGAPAGPQYVAHITTGLSASNLSVAAWDRDGSTTA